MLLIVGREYVARVKTDSTDVESKTFLQQRSCIHEDSLWASSDEAEACWNSTGRFHFWGVGNISNAHELVYDLKEGEVPADNFASLVLNAYKQWGTDCLKHFQGHFSFILADIENRRLLIASDTLSFHNLAYRLDAKGLACSTSIRSLAHLPFFPPPSIDPEAVALFFRYQYIPHPHTIYENIFKVAPGTALLVDFSGAILKQWCFSRFQFTPDNEITMENAIRGVDTVLHEVIQEEAWKRKSCGLFLSGGVDSTIVGHVLASVLGKEVPAFTIAFQEQDYSELTYAEQAAKKIGLCLCPTVLTQSSLDALEEILYPYGEPYGDSSVLPTWHACQAARQVVTDIFGGDGSDEFFGGYLSHTDWACLNGMQGMVRVLDAMAHLRLRSAVSGLKQVVYPSPPFPFWDARMSVFSHELRRRLLAVPEAGTFRPHLPDNANDLDDVQCLDIQTYLPGCMVPKIQVPSQYHDLRIHTPFLTARITSLATSLPAHLRVDRKGHGKILLKSLLQVYGFPHDFIFRKKQGFGLPLSYWFLPGGKARLMLEERLHAQEHELAEFISIPFVLDLLKQHSLERDNSARLWLILAFAIWIEKK